MTTTRAGEGDARGSSLRRLHVSRARLEVGEQVDVAERLRRRPAQGLEGCLPTLSRGSGGRRVGLRLRLRLVAPHALHVVAVPYVPTLLW